MREATKIVRGIKSHADYQTALRISGASHELIDAARQLQPGMLREAMNRAFFLQEESMPMGAEPNAEFERAMEKQVRQLAQPSQAAEGSRSKGCCG